jgi:hypothetical protein
LGWGYTRTALQFFKDTFEHAILAFAYFVTPEAWYRQVLASQECRPDFVAGNLFNVLSTNQFNPPLCFQTDEIAYVFSKEAPTTKAEAGELLVSNSMPPFSLNVSGIAATAAGIGNGGAYAYPIHLAEDHAAPHGSGGNQPLVIGWDHQTSRPPLTR